MMKLPITLIILTYNEEVTIKGCLESAQPHFPNIVVLDSESTDKTRDIAEKAGAAIAVRPFDNYAAQRQHALNTLAQENKWVFFLDADERITAELAAELQKLVESKTLDDHSLYRLRRKDYFFNRWLKRSSGYPTWFGRLCKVGEVRVERDINEEYHTDGRVGLLDSHLDHFPFMKGTSHWFDRHNRYSDMEARRLVQEQAALNLRDIFSRDPADRRKALKSLFYRLPLRPLIAFLYLYIFRLGFLDGYPGFLFCCMRACYEFMIGVKRREFSLKNKHI